MTRSWPENAGDGEIGMGDAVRVSVKETSDEGERLNASSGDRRRVACGGGIALIAADIATALGLGDFRHQRAVDVRPLDPVRSAGGEVCERIGGRKIGKRENALVHGGDSERRIGGGMAGGVSDPDVHAERVAGRISAGEIMLTVRWRSELSIEVRRDAKRAVGLPRGVGIDRAEDGGGDERVGPAILRQAQREPCICDADISMTFVLRTESVSTLEQEQTSGEGDAGREPARFLRHGTSDRRPQAA